MAVWAGGRLPGRRAGAVHCNAAAALPGGLVQALPSRLRLHSFFSIVSYTRAAPARRRFAAGGGREDKAHYAQSAKLQLKPLTEEGALAATTQRKRRWRRHAAHAAATVLPPPTAPTTHVVENFNRVYYFFQRHVSSTMVYTSTIKTQMNQEFYCCWADWAVRAVRTIAAIWGIPNFAKVSFF